MTYDEGVLALDGDVTDLAVLAEGLLEVVGAGAPAEAPDVDLRVL